MDPPPCNRAKMNEAATEKHEYLTVRELADLLRIKERKVYDLAANGEVPCSRATGKLLFPAAEVRAWIEKAKSGGAVEDSERPAIFLGSHDPLLDWAIRQSRCGLATFFDGSHDGLSRFAADEGVATGLHIYEPKTSDWNAEAAESAAAGKNAVLLTFATRKRGIVFGSGLPHPSSLKDLAGLRVVPRQPESGTANLFEQLAGQHGLDLKDITLTDVARTEDDAVQLVRQGEADATFGLESVALTYGLSFQPVIEERFDILVDRKAWFDPPLQKLIKFCQTEAFRHRAESALGYDVSGFGQVVWNG